MTPPSAREPSPELKGKTVLITGGTGFFGKRFIDHLLRDHEPAAVPVFSRDELKQSRDARRFGDAAAALPHRRRPRPGRLRMARAFKGVDVVVHAAALKQVPACEYNPFEAVHTNVIGAENIVDGGDRHTGSSRSSRCRPTRPCNPVNLYGATKLCAEKIFVQGNAYAGTARPASPSCATATWSAAAARVVPLFSAQAHGGEADRSPTRG